MNPMNATSFQTATARVFRFLERDYRFRKVDPRNAMAFPPGVSQYYVRYENATTGITIHLEPVEQLPVIHIQRLKGRKDVYPIGLLLIAIAPNLNPLALERSLPLKQSARTLLERYAHALKAVGSKVLRGDFAVFRDLHRLRNQGLRLRANGLRRNYYY